MAEVVGEEDLAAFGDCVDYTISKVEVFVQGQAGFSLIFRGVKVVGEGDHKVSHQVNETGHPGMPFDSTRRKRSRDFCGEGLQGGSLGKGKRHDFSLEVREQPGLSEGIIPLASPEGARRWDHLLVVTAGAFYEREGQRAGEGEDEDDGGVFHGRLSFRKRVVLGAELARGIDFKVFISAPGFPGFLWFS